VNVLRQPAKSNPRQPRKVVRIEQLSIKRGEW
jgi:hypothetical protein